ncbi:uncharacterized protein LOC125851943, partial [Solanum stenotomum]|uniref:uncharacterized protein LOC125851943 n=1 Tax=Solanum stenotomum TaxID=172797 RepID=UPI0020D13C13
MIDKSWIESPIKSKEFSDGVVQFLEFAFSNVSIDGKILCPCIICGFSVMRNRAEVFSHLLQRGFPKKYTCWHMHGEKQAQSSVESLSRVQNESARQYPMHDMLNGIFGFTIMNFKIQVHKIYQIMTILEVLKVLCGATEKTFSMILDLLRDVFPHAKLPSSFYESKKMIKKLGLGYDKIDACPNHCMLYWGSSEDESRDKCKVCNTSRYMSNENDIGANVVIDDQHRKKPKPAKVLRYFPLIPRLKRLYMCSKTTELLKWHATEANSDGLLRHPRDGKAWKHFDSFYPDFALETRNVRYALATDGFNPFGNLSSSVSIWPVMLYIYNYPPWCFMKQSSLIMSMIIPGPKMPGNSIDVYLQPLIAELKQLWDGVNAYDSSTKEMFQLHAAL